MKIISTAKNSKWEDQILVRSKRNYTYDLEIDKARSVRVREERIIILMFCIEWTQCIKRMIHTNNFMDGVISLSSIKIVFNWRHSCRSSYTSFILHLFNVMTYTFNINIGETDLDSQWKMFLLEKIHINKNNDIIVKWIDDLYIFCAILSDRPTYWM